MNDSQNGVEDTMPVSDDADNDLIGGQRKEKPSFYFAGAPLPALPGVINIPPCVESFNELFGGQ
jgi:hypothetical protein